MEAIKPIAEKIQRTAAPMQSQPNTDNELSCEVCRDTTVEIIPGHGARPCSRCWRKKHAAACLSLMDSRYREFSLETIRPLPERHRGQTAAIAQIKADPSRSFQFFGANGTGKTLFGWLLYRHAAEQGRPVVGLKLRELVEQLRDQEMGRLQPFLTVERLRRANTRWLIFLDEFDKSRTTEFSSESLFAVLDAAYSYKHQVVITSNLRPSELQDHWSRALPSYGPSMMRRLYDLDDAVLVDLF